MLRHFLITTWRSLEANRLQSAIAIFGLSLGLAAAILAGLLIVNQLSFDHFIPGSDSLYFAATKDPFGGSRRAEYGLSSPHDLAALIEQNVPGIQEATRFQGGRVRLRRGDMESRESVYWADGMGHLQFLARDRHAPRQVAQTRPVPDLGEPLHARVAKHNRSSIRVLEKCGFVMVGEDIWPADELGGAGEEWIMRLAAS